MLVFSPLLGQELTACPVVCNCFSGTSCAIDCPGPRALPNFAFSLFATAQGNSIMQYSKLKINSSSRDRPEHDHQPRRRGGLILKLRTLGGWLCGLAGEDPAPGGWPPSVHNHVCVQLSSPSSILETEKEGGTKMKMRMKTRKQGPSQVSSRKCVEQREGPLTLQIAGQRKRKIIRTVPIDFAVSSKLQPPAQQLPFEISRALKKRSLGGDFAAFAPFFPLSAHIHS